MSVVSVTLSWRSREQKRGSESTRTDIYTVIATAPVSGDVRDEIEAHASIPAYGSSPSDRPDLFARDITTREGGGPNVWEVLVNYSTVQNSDADPDQDPEHPEYDPPTIEFGEMQVTEVFDVATDGTIVRNSALEPFDPPMQRTRIEHTLIFTRNFAECTVTPSWVALYTDVVNNETITDFGARGEVRIVGSPRPVWVPPNGPLVGHWHVAFTLLIRSNPDDNSESESGADVPSYAAHFRRVLDQGYRTLVGYDSDEIPMYEMVRGEDGSPVNQPVQLAGDGTVLLDGAAAVYRYFREFPERDLSPLSIVWPYCDGESESASGSGSET